jgi:hypothetical protein
MRFFHKRDREPSEATRARILAEQELKNTRAQTPKYRALAQSLIHIQEVNHLGQNAARALRGEK